jgi:hypothetical protein
MVSEMLRQGGFARVDVVPLLGGVAALHVATLQKGINKLHQSRRRQQLQEWVGQNLSRRFAERILDVDLRVAVRWGELAGAAGRSGRKVPVLDGLLAATALEFELTIVTANTRHFESTDVPWLDPWRP